MPLPLIVAIVAVDASAFLALCVMALWPRRRAKPTRVAGRIRVAPRQATKPPSRPVSSSPRRFPPAVWRRLVDPIGDECADLVRLLLDAHVAHNVAALGMSPVRALNLAERFSTAATAENVTSIVGSHYQGTFQDAFIDEVGRLLREFNGPKYVGNPDLYEEQFALARCWYLAMTAADEISVACGVASDDRLYAQPVVCAARRASESFAAVKAG